MKRAGLHIAGILATSVVYASATASEATRSPGELAGVLRDATVIASAEFAGEESHPNTSGWPVLRLRLVKILQGTAKTESVLIPALLKSITYSDLHEARQVLLFLKEGNGGALELAGPRSYVRLEGADAGFAEELQAYLDIARNRYKSEEGRKAFREFVIQKTSTGKSEYFRQSMAQQLWDMVRDVPLHGFTEEDIVAIARAAASEESFSVTEPLCLVLDKLSSGKTDDCIFHALIEASVDRTSVPLASVIARRENLVQRLLTRAEDMRDAKDSGRLFLVLNHLFRVPETKLLPALRVLAQKNPAAIVAVKAVVGNYADGARHTLRRDLEEMEKAKDTPR